MGLFDLLSKEGRAKSALKRSLTKVLAKHAQSADRFAAMAKLREIGTDEALYGLAKRFSYVYDKTIEDEQEKEWVCDSLVGAGERAIGPVTRYAIEGDTLSYALRVLEKITTPAQMYKIVDDLMEREEPGYTRTPTKKLQLLAWLGEWRGGKPADNARRVVPYLADFDEGVRFAAAEALSHPGSRDEASRDALIAAILRPEEESRRIKMRCAEVLAEAGWPVGAHKDALVALVTAELPEFTVTGDKLVRKAK